jgi:hypothetical protein
MNTLDSADDEMEEQGTLEASYNMLLLEALGNLAKAEDEAYNRAISDVLADC